MTCCSSSWRWSPRGQRSCENRATLAQRVNETDENRAMLAERAMSTANLVGLILSVLVTVFLVVALVFPEKF